MKKHYIKIKDNDDVQRWAFVFAYDIGEEDTEEMGDWLEALGAGRKEIEHACDVILGKNKGFTYSNPDLRMSLMCISRVTSIDQWFDSMTHEVDHLQWEIMQYYDVDPGTEEAAWLQGYIVRMIIKAIAR